MDLTHLSPRDEWKGRKVNALHRSTALIAAAGMVVAGLSGCALVNPPSSPIFRINGTCTTKGGTLHGLGSGFSESTTYQTTATKPDGTLYDTSKYAQFGITSATGTIDAWSWPCKGDPSGTYSVSIKDLKTGSTVKTKFTIG